MRMTDEDADVRRRRVTGKAAAVFIAVMLFLTFFSNTINNFSLPRVSYENPLSGALIKEVTGTGNVKAKTVRDLYLRTGMKVTDVPVKVGDGVKKGQLLMTLDTGDIEEQLKNEQDIYAQKQLNLQKLTDAASPANMLSLDRAVDNAEQSLEDARKAYGDRKSQYEAGVITADELKNAKRDLDSAQLNLDVANSNRNKAVSDNNNSVESAKLDIGMEQRKIADLEDEMKMGRITAPCDGTVTELAYSEGMTANTSQPLYKIADARGGFQFTATVDISAAAYLEPGDTAGITISSMNNSTIQGKVDQITDNVQQIGVKKDVLIDIPPDGLIGGESGTADIKKNIGSYNTLAPNSAIGQDSSGYFVYVLKERNGPLGNEFYVQKVTVGTGDSDNIKTAVLSGITSMDKVISDSDKALSDGARVMLADGGE